MSKSKTDEAEKLDLNLKYAFDHNVNFKERTILLNQDIDEEAFSLIEVSLTEMESHSRQPVTIKVCSGGGSVYAALAIVGRIRQSKCKITTEGHGNIQSAATLILASGKHRVVSRYCIFMHHESSYSVEGRHSEIKVEIAEAERQEQIWAQWMGEFTKKPKKFYLDEGKHTNKYWSVEQLLEFGIVDEII